MRATRSQILPRNGRPSPRRLPAELATRLRARRAEIEQAVLTRVNAISDPTDLDPAYRDGLRIAIGVSLDYALETIERGERRAPPPPAALLSQARVAARNGIGLDTVLRRYLAGYGLIGDYLVEEVERGNLCDGSALRRMLRDQAAVFDRLLAAVSEEHAREAHNHTGSNAQRLVRRVKCLLAGELIDSSELGYDFDGHHVGLIAIGPGAAERIRELAASLDYRLLLVQPDETTIWAWLGGRRPPDVSELSSQLSCTCSDPFLLVFGDPGEGLTGWRLTHRQALAAVPVAQRAAASVVCYSDVAVVASVLQDDLLVTSLHERYLKPLLHERNAASTEKTLRAYFACERNVTSAAASLGISRQAANARLRSIQRRLGRPLGSCAVEMELALRLKALED
jgi:hypothetical protein